MPEFCTCGAQLPPDALFCHKCGKPQREILAPEPPSEEQAAAPPLPPTSRWDSLPLDFRNAAAVRIGLMPGQDPALIQQMIRFFQSGPGMAVVVTFSLMAMFLVITFLSMAGGALGAKVVGRH